MAEKQKRTRIVVAKKQDDSSYVPKKTGNTLERSNFTSKFEKKQGLSSKSESSEYSAQSQNRNYVKQPIHTFSQKNSRKTLHGDEQFDAKQRKSKNSDFESKQRYQKQKTNSTFSQSHKPDVQSKSDNEPIRLNRFIANAGVCSRREADELIASGIISVNGSIVTEMGYKVQRTDKVLMNGKELVSQKKVYILLNKPKDCITTKHDPEGRRTVFDYIQGACAENVEPVGRLDRNTTGVLLFTNDGELTEKILHPRYNKMKIYHAFLDKNLKLDDFQSISEGVELEDGLVEVDDLQYVNAQDKSQIGIQIHSGKNHVVKRIFEKFGYTVEKLDRVYFAGLTKKNLPRGKWR
ncbi:MAG TPA: pseudouridine synthase, partial [Bacteroidales bacterium]|nr:pseudouridine synthase [Bacteroidales bacterium]